MTLPTQSNGHFPSLRQKKKLSQVFLNDYSAVAEIFDNLDLKGKAVLEIGAGTGAITKKLARMAKKVIALEIDAQACEILRDSLAAQKNVEILNADALQASLNYPVIIGFLPYHISSPLLFKILASNFKEAIICVQKEFAERMVAMPGTRDYSRLSVMAQSKADITYLATVPKEAFSPIPKVDSALAYLVKNPKFALSEPLVTALFQHKNQRIRKALMHSGKALGLSKERIGEFLLMAGQNPPKSPNPSGPDLSPTKNPKQTASLTEKRVRTLTLEELSALSLQFERFISSAA
ncbi:MAG TPA: 16S rRNA (adenine(1518)-N(6)/adenine(1519)-N(6))-dimethyltransferase RsmA [Candidatus Norongarragalinales archaeon]|nr:16S rRNA (adenine(1518)-N(6)/adenine(1519)-N(6))-dimethyltransferase RsmA [Candidatus Norongarragalinales archaeon]